MTIIEILCASMILFSFFKKYDEWVTLSSASIVASIDAGSKGFCWKRQTLTNLYSVFVLAHELSGANVYVVHAKTRFAGYGSVEVYHHSSIVHMNDFRSSQEIIDFVESMNLTSN